jgi:hypothetical protein
MALTTQKTKVEANSIEVICTEMTSLLARIEHILEHNSDLSIDWGGDPKPDYIAEDADGNIDGLLYSRAEVSNAIFSLEQVQKTLTNQAITQGDHLGNLNKLARPVITR